MADKFLYHGGNNIAPYETPADAATTLAGLLAGTVVAEDETIWVKNDHLESAVVSTTFTSEGATAQKPLKVLCTNDWVALPSSLSTGAIIATTGNYALFISGNWLFHGITFNPCITGLAGSSSNTTVCYSVNGPHTQFFSSCTFVGMSHVAAHPIIMGNSANTGNDASTAVFSDCAVKFGNTSARLNVKNGKYSFNNLSFVPGSFIPTSLFNSQNYAALEVMVTNSDWGSVSIGSLVDPSAGFNGRFTFRNCKCNALTTAESGVWTAPGSEVLLINSSSGDNHWTHEGHGYEGGWSVSTSIFATTTPADMSSVASDNFSIQMVSSANVSRHLPLYSQWFAVPNDGVAYVPAIEVLAGDSDINSALNSDELWLEVDYNNDTTSPLGTRLTTLPDLITVGPAVSVGTTAWTGDTYDPERTHKLTVSEIIPDKPGYILMRVALGKPSTIIYVNPPR